MNKKDTLATEVMNWELVDDDKYGINETDFIWRNEFDPWEDSTWNDNLIEAFVGNKGNMVCEMYLTWDFLSKKPWKCRFRFHHAESVFAATAKKNEAVCEAIYKAVTK